MLQETVISIMGSKGLRVESIEEIADLGMVETPGAGRTKVTCRRVKQ